MSSENILQQVITYNKSELAFLLNAYCFINQANKKFKDFDKDVPGNLGNTVGFEKPPLFTTNASLVANFQPIVQRVQNLTVDKQISTAVEWTSQQFIFNDLENYMKRVGKGCVYTIGSKIEADVASLAESNTYRFYGDGLTPFSTSLQLSKALAYFRSYGFADKDLKGFLDMLTYPAIVNSNLAQFVLDRNEKEAMSWEIGKFNDCEWFQSNELKVHTSGTEGNTGTALTVVSVVTDSNGGVIQMTLSGTNAPNDPNSMKQYDKGVFSDGVSGVPNVRFLTWMGGIPAQNPVQFQVTADSASTSGSQVTINIFPALQATAGNTQNITTPIVPGMQVTFLPSHRCGLIYSGDALFLAMPKLNNQEPYPTSAIVDPETGCSLRKYWGTLFGQNQQGMITDAIWGKTLVQENAMLLPIPL